MKTYIFAVLAFNLVSVPSFADDVKDLVDLISSRTKMVDADVARMHEFFGPPELVKAAINRIVVERLQDLKSSNPVRFNEFRTMINGFAINRDLPWQFWNIAALVLTSSSLSEVDLTFLRNAQTIGVRGFADEMPSLTRVVSWRFTDSSSRVMVDTIFANTAAVLETHRNNPQFLGDHSVRMPFHWLIRALAMSSGKWARESRLYTLWFTYTNNLKINLNTDPVGNEIAREYEKAVIENAADRVRDLNVGRAMSREDLLILLKYDIDVFEEMFKHSLPADFLKRLSFDENLRILINHKQFHKKLYETGTPLYSILGAAEDAKVSLNNDLVETVIKKRASNDVELIISMIVRVKNRGRDSDPIWVDSTYENFTYALRKRVERDPDVLSRLWEQTTKYPELAQYMREAFPETPEYKRPHKKGVMTSLRLMTEPIRQCVREFIKSNSGD